MIYDVEFSLDAAAELLRITEVVGSALSVLRAADQIRRHLENDPADKGHFSDESGQNDAAKERDMTAERRATMGPDSQRKSGVYEAFSRVRAEGFEPSTQGLKGV
jgi:hypothetical protein